MNFQNWRGRILLLSILFIKKQTNKKQLPEKIVRTKLAQTLSICNCPNSRIIQISDETGIIQFAKIILIPLALLRPKSIPTL